MIFRPLTAALLLATSTAAADDLALVPVCAALADSDELPAAEGPRALATFVRSLEEADQLVVTEGCEERYRVGHTTESGDFVVRMFGAHATRAARNPDRGDLAMVYRMLIDQVIEAERAIAAAPPSDQEAEEEQSPTREPEASSDGEEEEDEAEGPELVDAYEPPVRTDTTLYVQGLAGSQGVGLGIGARIPTGSSLALDLHAMHAEKDLGSFNAIGAKLLSYTRPQSDRSVYYGGGLAYSNQEAMSYDGLAASASGVQLDGTVGVMFNRQSSRRIFLQADLGLRAYGTWTPTFMVSIGGGG